MRCLTGDIDRADKEFRAAIVDFVTAVGPLHPDEAIHAAYFANCLLQAGRIDVARSIMEAHGKLDPPRKDIAEEDRADIAAVWERLSQTP